MQFKTQTLLLSLWVIFPLNLQAQCDPIPSGPVPLGANLNGIADWARDRPFNDVFKSSRPFSSQIFTPWQEVPPQLDADGWPLEDFGVVVMVEMSDGMGGIYSMRFEGQATLTPVASNFSVHHQQYDSTTNLTTASLVFADSIPAGEQMMIAFTNTQYAPGVGGVKQIQIMKPGLGFDAPTFSSPFLNHLQRFSVLRFMDWHHTNGNLDSLWLDRTLLTSPRQTGAHGAAWEYCFELANELDKDLWINVPHRATNNYVIQLAQLADSLLEPDRKLYVEYSNEVWNWSFEQANWNLAQAIDEAMQPGHPLNFDNANDQWTWHYRRIALRGKEISDLFRGVFGDSAMMTRVRPIYAVQISWFDVGQRGLEFINEVYGPPNQYFYALAGAPYFNSFAADSLAQATAQDILNALSSSMNEGVYVDYENWLDQYAAFSYYYGLKFFSYEGGPDTFGPDHIQAKAEANRDPQIKPLLESYLNQWYGYGHDALFCWFTGGAGNWETPFGTWSLTENFENSYKLQAMDALLNGPLPVLQAGVALPGKMDARRYAGFPQEELQNAYFQPNISPRCWTVYNQYLIRVPEDQAGTYQFRLKVGSFAAGESLEVWVDNDSLNSYLIPQTNNPFALVYTDSDTLELEAGFHTVRFYFDCSQQYFIDSLIFDPIQLCSTPTGLDDGLAVRSWRIYPNPAAEYVRADWPEGIPSTLRLWTVQGQLIRVYPNVLPGQRLSLAGIGPGLYVLRKGRTSQLLVIR